MNDKASEPTGKLRFTLMGGCTLRRADGTLVPIASRKNRLLLAFLASTSGTAHSRDKLADMFWHNRQEDQARGSLRTALSSLKQLIGGEALESGREAVSIRPGFISTDLQDLREMAEKPPGEFNLDTFYGGEFLAEQDLEGDQFSDWLRAMRQESHDLAISVLSGNADRLEKLGEIGGAIDRWRECLALEPLREATHRQIMRLYALNGERAMALSQFRTCKELLQHELGVGPDPDTEALAESIAKRDGNGDSAVASDPITTTMRAAKPADPATAKSVPDKPSIAVIPFVNMSGDAEQSYFTDGIWEDVLTDLGSVDNLSVAAKGAGNAYRGIAMHPKDIARELGVRFILEGSVRRAGDQVRISVQLTDAPQNQQVWADRFDRRLDNIFEVQAEVSDAIVSALRRNLAVDLGESPHARAQTDLETYDIYLKARDLLRNANRKTLKDARSLFAKVVERDPGYAPGYTGLADCGSIMVQHYDFGPETLEEALANCEKALEIDPNLAEAYAARGYILTHRADKDAARYNLLKAVQIAPKLANAHYYLAKFYLGAANEPDLALEAAQKAYDLESDVRTGMILASCFAKVGRNAEVTGVSERSIEIAKRRLASDPYDAYSAMHLAINLAYLGRFEEGKRWARLASSLESEDGAITYNLACAFSVMGMTADALEQVQRTLDLGCSKIKVHYMNTTDPDIEPIRHDPRFKEMIRNYWQKRMSGRRAARAQGLDAAAGGKFRQ